MTSLAKLIQKVNAGTGYTVQIWIDAEDGQQTHIYIKRSDEHYSSHYFYWSDVLLWHDIDIIHASTIIIKH